MSEITKTIINTKYNSFWLGREERNLFVFPK